MDNTTETPHFMPRLFLTVHVRLCIVYLVLQIYSVDLFILIMILHELHINETKNLK